MTRTQVENILNEKMSNEDRRYWEAKLSEIIRKENNAKENERYFNKMTKYDR